MEQAAKMLGRLDLLGELRQPGEDYAVLPSGNRVKIRVLNGLERARFQIANMNLWHTDEAGQRRLALGDDDPCPQALLVSMGTVDSENRPLFTEADSQLLSESNGIVLQALYDAIYRFNKLDRKEVDEAKKNSAPADS